MIVQFKDIVARRAFHCLSHPNYEPPLSAGEGMFHNDTEIKAITAVLC